MRMSSARNTQDFVLAIEAVADGKYRSLVLEGAVGAHSSAPFEPPFGPEETENILLGLGEHPRQGILTHPTAQRVVEPKREVVRQATETSMDLKEVGVTLYRALFRGAVGESFHQSLERARAVPNTHFRLRLVFGVGELGPDYLAALPWDLLQAPSAQDFMTLGDEISVIRQLRVPEQASHQPIESTLRVLVAMSTPTGLHPLRLDREWESFQQILGKVPGVDFEPFERAPIEELRDRLLQGKFQCLHFMGHGDLDRSRGVGELFFEAADRSPRPISGSLLAANLRNLPDLRLTVLNACHSGALAFGKGVDPFLGVSASLLRAGLSAVVAMQTSVPDSHAMAFSRGFYGALAQGRPTETALFEGRLRMLNTVGEQSSSWAVPVLFMGPGQTQSLVAGEQPVGTDLPNTAEEAGPSSTIPSSLVQLEETGSNRAVFQTATGGRRGIIIAAVLLLLVIGWWVGGRVRGSLPSNGTAESLSGTAESTETISEKEDEEAPAVDDAVDAPADDHQPTVVPKPVPQVPLQPPRASRVAIVVYNTSTSAADRGLGRIFETAAAADLQSFSIALPQPDNSLLESIMRGDYSRLSSSAGTAWGAELLLLVTASSRDLPPPMSNVRAVGLSAAFTVISLPSQAVILRSRGDHTGMGISEDAALAQAAARCAREVVEFIKEDNYGV